MQAVAYKNGGLKGNWLALYACMMNPKLTSSQALKYICEGCKEIAVAKPTKEKKIIPIHAIRVDYEKGMTIVELKFKYNLTNISIGKAIKEAGGTTRPRGNKSGQKKNRTAIGC